MYIRTRIQTHDNHTHRRDFLKTSLLAAGSSVLPLGADPDERPPVAAIITEYRHWSDADVIITKLGGL
ncbi:MAG: hypothetical protein O2968_18110 [Acidobacteria bacterium]|nr:hypothetical protein [Acidobacteriota bacterium]